MINDILSTPDAIEVFARKILNSEDEAQAIDDLTNEFGSERYFFLKQAYKWADNEMKVSEIPICASSSYPAILQMFASLVTCDHRGRDEELEEKRQQISSLENSPPTEGNCLVVGLSHNDCANASGFRIYNVGFDTVIVHAKTRKAKRANTSTPGQLLQYGAPIQF